MLKAQRSSSRVQKATTASVPAPTGGWNARDSLAQMPSQDAVILDNYVPSPYDVFLRDGYIFWATGVPGIAETVMNYSTNTGEFLFAIASGNIFNVTSGGPVGAPVVTGLSNSRWQYTNFATPGGKFLLLFNGLDNGILFNGTTWGPTTITGVATNLIKNVNIFKERVFLVEKNSTRAWFLPVNSIGGAASPLDFGSIFRSGGFLSAMGTWSLDAGYGVDDYAVFVSSNGEVLIYKGTDPSNAATWGLVGSFAIGSPIGDRFLTKYAGDLLIISRDGLLPFASSLQSSRINTHQSLTDKIQWPTSEMITNYANNFGWETILFPDKNVLMLNIPISSGISYQFVMNTITGAWCRFKGWNAATFCLLNDELYFGGSGYIAKAWTGQNDAGIPITGEALQSFNYFDSPGRLKKFNEVRPYLTIDIQPNLLLDVNVDFDVTRPTGIATPVTITPSIWDTAIWDVSLWGGATLQRLWETVTGIGQCGALHIISVSDQSTIRWSGTDYVFELGGVI